jgi:hypothetical protein
MLHDYVLSSMPIFPFALKEYKNGALKKYENLQRCERKF